MAVHRFRTASPDGRIRSERTRLALQLALLLVLLPGCRAHPERLRHLPLAGAEAIKISGDARPARRLPAGQVLDWTIPSARAATLWLSIGIAQDDPEPDVEAEFRISREAGGTSTLLRTVRLKKGYEPKWTEVEIPWAPHRRMATLRIEASSWIKGEPANEPADTPALVSEPVLVPDRLPADPPIVVIYMVDTLRADHLRSYGGTAAPGTPEFDRLAREGLRVERMVAPASWTLPSHASLFTSTAVTTHGVVAADSVLGPELPTLAETYRLAGYRTFAVTNGGFVDPSYGLARGFERYLSVNVRQENVVQSVTRVLDLVRDHPREPLFVFFHTFQVHEYQAVELFPPDAVPSRREKTEALRKKYAEEVVLTDQALGLLRRGLAETGVASRTVLVATSDHGEALGGRPSLPEPLHFGHGHPYLHDEEIRIPFLLFAPKAPRAGTVLKSPSTLLDVAPTLLEISGLAAPPTFEGTSLFALERDPEAARTRLLLSLSPQYPAFAFERAGRKLILRPAQGMVNWWGGQPYPAMPPMEAYDLAADPDETSPRAAKQAFLAPFLGDLERTIPVASPGSLVVRVPAEAGRVEFRARTTGRWESVTTIGGAEASAVVESDQKREVAGSLPGGPAPRWLFLRPERFGDGTELSLRCRRGVTVTRNDGAALPGGRSTLSWNALSSPRKAVPGAVQIFSTPSSHEGSRARIPEEVLKQLRSLGYVTAGRDPAGPAKPSANSSAAPDTLVLTLEENLP